MNYENLIKLLNTLAQEYLFLDTKDIDIPTAGKLLNQLELIIDEAKKIKINSVKSCAASLSQILEKTILDAIDDKDNAASVFESGIHLMQEIADSYNNTGKYDGNIKEFLEKTKDVEMTEDQVAEMKATQEKLMTSAQNLFSKMYEQSQASGAGPDMGGYQEGPDMNQGPADDVVDGDYREV